MSKNVLLDKSKEFAIDSIELYKDLTKKNEFVLSKQFLKSSTSIGANLNEAKYAESKKDFVHKLSVSLKECKETLYWLDLLKYYHNLDTDKLNNHKKKCSLIEFMLIKSINTLKNNSK